MHSIIQIRPVDKLPIAYEEEGSAEIACTLTKTKASSIPNHSIYAITLQQPELGYGNHSATKGLLITGFTLPDSIDWCLANGIQCWSKSPLLNKDDKLYNENDPTQIYFGDDHLIKSSEQPGQLHSWNFSYAGNQGEAASLFFSHIPSGEKDFFAAFQFDLREKTLRVFIDTEGDPNLPVEWFCILPDSLFTPKQTEKVDLKLCLRTHVALRNEALKVKAVSIPDSPTLGYTSWYYRYTEIDPAWLQKNLQSMQGKTSWNMFQIDDGYQKKIGDWLDLKPEFQNGFDPLLQEIKSKDKTPGIWLAPFVAVHDSKILQQHPDWMLKTQDGGPVLCGDFPHWGGKFYALDPKHSEVQAYLRKVLDYYFVQREFKFLKADFLYATGKVPGQGISRAQASYEAIAWLSEECRKRGISLLSCGSYLQTSFQLCEFARIGPDVAMDWELPEKRHTTSREKCSTLAATMNALTRFPLDKVAHGNDPDVFILRKESQRLTGQEQAFLAEVHSLTGSLIFTSDNLETYTEQAKAWWDKMEEHILLQRKPSPVYIGLKQNGTYFMELDSKRREFDFSAKKISPSIFEES